MQPGGCVSSRSDTTKDTKSTKESQKGTRYPPRHSLTYLTGRSTLLLFVGEGRGVCRSGTRSARVRWETQELATRQ